MGQGGTEEFGGAVTRSTAAAVVFGGDASVDTPDLAGLMATAAMPETAECASTDVAALIASVGKAPTAPRLRRRVWRDLFIGGLLVALTHIFLVQVSVVRGLSMSPSLRDGDRLMVDRISYSLTNVDRFDVVVLRYPKNPKVDFVKRVIGLPGDRIELRGGLLHVNGENLPERFAHIVDVHAHGAWLVPRDSFFVLGDNRPISCDSREFGMVRRANLQGKVCAVFWPLDRFVLF